jgi:hypothetical protein
MLAFDGQEMIGDAQERVYRDGGADFFQGFTNGALLEGLQKVEFASHDAPATGLGRAAAEREEQAAGLVNQKNTHAHPRIIRAEQGGAPFVLN